MNNNMSAKGGSAFGGKKQSVVSSILWLTIAEVFFNLSGYIIHSSLGRMLGPADYGRYALIITLTTMMIMLIGNGIPTAMSKYLSEVFETKPDLVLVIKRQAAILQFTLIGIVTLAFYLLAPVIATLLNDQSLIPLLQISTFIIPSYAAASFYLYYYIGIHRFNVQSTMKIVRSFARIGFVLYLAYLFKLKGSIASYILSPAPVFLIAWIIDKFWIDKQFPKKTTNVFDWKKLLNYAWPVTLFMLFYEMLISLDLYMVKALLGDDTLTGIYNAALTVGRIPYYLFYALTMVMLPSISRTTSQNNHVETNRIISQTFRMMIMILIPLTIGMIVYAEPLVVFFFGAKFATAALSTQILTFGVSFLTVFYVMCFAMNGAGMVFVPMFISLFGMLLNALLNYFFVLKYGIAGSAIATTITSIFITIIILWQIHKHFKGLMSPAKFLKFVSAGAIMLLVSMFLPAKGLLFIPYGLALTAVYFIFLVLIKEFTLDDVDLFKKMLFSRKKKVVQVPIEDAN
jgi:stage V sporulation protein B